MTAQIATVRYSLAEWSDAINEIFVPMDMSGAGDSFSVTVRTRGLNDIRILDVTSTAHRAVRQAQHVARDDLRYFCITLQLEGSSTIAQDGVESILEPGDFAIYDSTRPFERRFAEGFRSLTLRFPHHMLSLPPHSLSRLTATRLAADEGLGLVVSPYLAEVARNLDQLVGWNGVLVAHTAIDLVSAALAEKLALAGEATQGDHAEAFLAACDYIRQNLGDPGLNPETVAAAGFISVRLLHKIFHAERTTVSHWIRERRLEQCRRQLSDPHEVDKSVGEIAASWGIHDAAHFSRLFRTAFGMSPREYRRTQLESLESGV